MILVNIILNLHLSFLSELTERGVKPRFADFLSTHNLLNSFQSAYIKHRSTETTLFSVHDHIIKAISHQQVMCLTLFDLSAAFDITDHFILFGRLILFWNVFHYSLLDQILFIKPFYLWPYSKL